MRCNAGISPEHMADQHLCEASELKMVPGTIKKRLKFNITKPIPDKFCLNGGHISFFYDKLHYLRLRHGHVFKECIARGRKCQSLFYDLSDFPDNLINDWHPTLDDSRIVRTRMVKRLFQKPKFYRYKGEPIDDMEDFCSRIMLSPLYTK